ncbi:MAG: neutral/alkaline non-lysosomal ceramidase N-terminal domain-containing protein [Rubripirellula sp.]|nr:neutral/alkaline non-lysosomal ceramidase N-terminal domain-containing protein [Rubripirellula sp.]
MRMFLLGMIALISLSASAAETFSAAAATADITPQKWPVPMVGSFSERLATHAWDPLKARALVLDNGTTRLGFVVVDSCYCPRELFDEAKRRAADICGMPADHILCSATHTHTAPASRDRREVDADPEYVELVTQGIVSALHQASSNLVDAEIGWGSCQVPEEVNNRRWFLKPLSMPMNPFGTNTDQVRMNPPRGKGILDRPAGPVDPQVMFLSVRTAEGRPIALLANYALHYVGGIPAGGVSADYFGEFARQMDERLFPDGPQDALRPFVAIMSNGTSGDINNIQFANPQPRKPPMAQMRHVASLVADRIFEAMPTVKYSRDVPLAMAQSELTLKVRKPSEGEVSQAKSFLAETDEKKLPPRAKAYARWAIKLDEHPGTEQLVLQAIRVGDVGITAIPCEVLVEIGLRLKQKSPLQPAFTIELANGHYGYLPDPKQHRLGGYETWLGTNTLEIEASEKIEAELLDLLNQVAQ